MILLLLDSALRSLLFGVLVWTLQKLLRVRDIGTETIVWTVVLVVSLAMPLLSHYLPRLVVTVPQLSNVPQQSMAALHSAGAGVTSQRLFWLAHHAQTLLLGAYGLGLMVCLTRLTIGLLQTVRLYLRAGPVQANWARGHHIRASATLRSPASLAGVILLPADYREWSAAKREAVVAHEGAHIARGDFFVQLVASFHCTLFWFSPFAWWLQSKLAEIAESASDEAAVQRLNDRVTYAEILLEVACRAQPSPPIVAMAKGPFIQQRLERILSDGPSRNLSAPLRMLIIGSLPLMAFALASARAAMTPIPSIAPVQRVASERAEAKASLSRSSTKIPAALGASRIRERIESRALQLAQTLALVQGSADEVSYNPRALLEPVYRPVRAYVPASTMVHAGKTFYILSTERPVADISAADGSYPRDN